MNFKSFLKNALRVTVSTALCASMLISAPAALNAHADGTHGFYMSCDSSVTGNKSNGFMIDFYSDSEEAWATYWSNANWSMNTDAFLRKYRPINFRGGGAYAGLQLLYGPEQRKGIMSFWIYEYTDRKTKEEVKLYAEAVYGKTTSYDNEGSGTSCVMDYDWKNHQWYRELLYCWEDEETGNTFMGNWYYDYEADKWDLFAYYDTKLPDSYITGDVGQFLENFVERYRETTRSFRYRNVYFQDLEHNWVSSPNVYLWSDGNVKAVGEATLGVSEDKTYVWASVDGKSEIDTDQKLELRTTLKQDAKPSYGTPVLTGATLGQVDGAPALSWNYDEHSTPQLSYKVVITGNDGKTVLKTLSGTRPEVNTLTLDLDTDAFKCDITVTDVFGQTTTTTCQSEKYTGTEEAPGESVTISGYKAYVDEKDVDLYVMFDDASVGKEVEVTVGDKTSKATVTKDGVAVTLATTALNDKVIVKFDDKVIEEYTLKEYLEAVSGAESASEAQKEVAAALLKGEGYTEHLTATK